MSFFISSNRMCNGYRFQENRILKSVDFNRNVSLSSPLLLLACNCVAADQISGHVFIPQSGKRLSLDFNFDSLWLARTQGETSNAARPVNGKQCNGGLNPEDLHCFASCLGLLQHLIPSEALALHGN